MGLLDEIYEQPAILRNWLHAQLPKVERIAARLREREIDYVLLAARGSSDHAGVYAKYAWGSRNGLPVALAAPSLFTRYPAPPRLDHALVLGISQSGRSPDVVSVISEGRRQGRPTLALTNDPASPLALAAEFVIDLGAGVEKAVAATKTYTAELIAVAALSAALSGNPDDLAALQQIPAAIDAALKLDSEAEQLAARYTDLGYCIVLGRGFSYCTAQEWALKLKELAYVFAEVYSTPDFQHGPIAILEPGFPVLAVAPSGAVLPDYLEILRRLRDDYRADLLVLSDNESVLELAGAGLRLPGGLPEWLTPVVDIVPAQLFCYHLTRLKGYDTEQPRTLRKITLTR